MFNIYLICKTKIIFPFIFVQIVSCFKHSSTVCVLCICVMFVCMLTMAGKTVT